MFDRTQFYIDGQWVDPAIAIDFDVIDPSTEEPCGQISLGSTSDVDAAVAAAKRAFPRWAQTPREERRALVEKLGSIMDARIKELGEAISYEMGAPIDFAINDQAACGPWHLKGFLKAFDRFDPGAAKVPALTVISDEDQTIDAAYARAVSANWGAAAQVVGLELGPGDDPGRHVILGDILSPGQTEIGVEAILGWLSDLGLHAYAKEA